jgi:beta-glucosidase
MSVPPRSEGFTWGVATSAYQIEGGRGEGGKGDSIWDRFVDQGHAPLVGDVACDHYHRLEEDLDLLAALGVDAYRFSVAWTRIFPEGDGEPNAEGLGFYEEVVDGLLERGIEPWLTLYHWDLPQALQERGGWANRSTVDAFVGFASTLAGHLGDRVRRWITHNEPWVATYLGHLFGVHPPGIRDWETAVRAGHHMLLSHGDAVIALRRAVSGAKIGIALDCRPALPASDAEADRLATAHFDGFRNRWFFDPVFGKGYPQDILEAFIRLGRVDPDPSFIRPGDMEAIAAPIDFLGLNYYTATRVSAGSEEDDAPARLPGPNQESGFTEMGWAIDPAGLVSLLGRIHSEYRPASIVITENGASYSDGPDATGDVDDSRRIDYLGDHIEAMTVAMGEGVPIDGYFVWSLLDNVEWTHGFEQRFGLVWVDPDTLVRIPKASFEWYRESISPHGWARRAVYEARSR